MLHAGDDAPLEALLGSEALRRLGALMAVDAEGRLRGTSVPLHDAGVLIGRNPECSLVLTDDYASGRHVRIYAGADAWYADDLGSTNGTYVNGAPVTRALPVGPGTAIRIGKTVMELEA